jgi:hypothetical protein
MADDLRERVVAGDLDALLDPALELHLLANVPTAFWWSEAVRSCAHSLNSKLVPLVLERDCDAMFDWKAEPLDMTRQLRALLPNAPPKLDAALAVLERYAR